MEIFFLHISLKYFMHKRSSRAAFLCFEFNFFAVFRFSGQFTISWIDFSANLTIVFIAVNCRHRHLKFVVVNENILSCCVGTGRESFNLFLTLRRFKSATIYGWNVLERSLNFKWQNKLLLEQKYQNISCEFVRLEGNYSLVMQSSEWHHHFHFNIVFQVRNYWKMWWRESRVGKKEERKKKSP